MNGDKISIVHKNIINKERPKTGLLQSSFIELIIGQHYKKLPKESLFRFFYMAKVVYFLDFFHNVSKFCCAKFTRAGAFDHSAGDSLIFLVSFVKI